MRFRSKNKVPKSYDKSLVTIELLTFFTNLGRNGVSIEDIEKIFPYYVPRRTLQRRLREWQPDLVIAKGEGRATRYYSAKAEREKVASVLDTADWLRVYEPHKIDTPALLVFPEQVRRNIQHAIEIAGSADKLRPHIKTCKSPDAVRLMQEFGIHKFKCATISEAEMLGMEHAKEVLLAYQPIGPKLERYISLIKKYPSTQYACLVDNMQVAKEQVAAFSQAGIKASLYVDLNVGMNRSGIEPGPDAVELIKYLLNTTVIQHVGLHVYDGQITSISLPTREREVKAGAAKVDALLKQLENERLLLQNISGGSPTFPIHAKQNNGECSPGTFVYWDMSYLDTYPEQNFLPAAVVLCRVVSIPGDKLITVDLGHKAIASEKEISKRVFFFGGHDLMPVSHSEEHLVLRNNGTKTYSPGDILFGIPYHICPTVALYERSIVIESGNIVGEWIHSARDRKIEV